MSAATSSRAGRVRGVGRNMIEKALKSVRGNSRVRYVIVIVFLPPPYRALPLPPFRHGQIQDNTGMPRAVFVSLASACMQAISCKSFENQLERGVGMLSGRYG